MRARRRRRMDEKELLQQFFLHRRVVDGSTQPTNSSAEPQKKLFLKNWEQYKDDEAKEEKQ